ncbi:MAG: hypothetical protein HY332_00925 [Chloroflexi bacterium]|nr:hypothetical protein [Chloroflexota bacterium]
MQIFEVKAFPMRVPKDNYAFAGTAGVEGEPLVGRETSSGLPGYFRAQPYPVLYSPQIETVFVKVTTDAGLVGFGEAQAPVGPEVVAQIVERLLAPIVVVPDRPGLGLEFRDSALAALVA